VFDQEIGEHVVVEGDATSEPTESVVVVGQVLQAASADNAVEDGVKPQGDEHAGIAGGSSPSILPGANAVVQKGEIEGLDETPDSASGVVLLDELIESDGGKNNLAFHRAQTGR
jgi:hypothetical protein